jgi:hypothetical protein
MNIFGMKIDVLDHGFVRLVDFMGNDLLLLGALEGTMLGLGYPTIEAEEIALTVVCMVADAATSVPSVTRTQL